MKKVSYLFVVAIFALASCTKQSVEQTNNTIETPENESNVSVDSGSSLTWTQEVLNENISSGTTVNEGSVTKKDFSLSYTMPNWAEATMSWYITIDNWVVTWVWWMEWLQGPQKTFAESIWNEIIWKEVSWLKIDTISWASLVTTAFNDFLSKNF